MVELHIEKKDRIFHPGEKLRVKLTWKQLELNTILDLSLGWRTEGKGTTDYREIATESLDIEQTTGTFDWEVKLPVGPWSVRGQLLSIQWYVACRPSDHSEDVEESLVIAPSNSCLQLEKIDLL
jgi:hypothetical protein